MFLEAIAFTSVVASGSLILRIGENDGIVAFLKDIKNLQTPHGPENI